MPDEPESVEWQLATIYSLLTVLESLYILEREMPQFHEQFPETGQAIRYIEDFIIEMKTYEARMAIAKEIGYRISQLSQTETNLEERMEMRKKLALYIPRWEADDY